MKDKIFRTSVLAVLMGFAELANAQSNVTLYGLLDTGFYYQNKTPNNQGSVFEALDGGIAGSRWGLTGVEDLGGGMHAGFKLEDGFSTTSGAFGNSNGGIFGRKAYLSLDGPFGTVQAGLQYSPFFLAVEEADASGFSNGGSGQIPYLDNFGIAGLFTSNVVTYFTPDVDGFSGAAMFGLGGVAGNFNAGKQESFSVKYEHKGAMVEVSYFDAHDTTGATTQQGRMVGTSYIWGLVTVSGAFVNYKMPTAVVIRNVNVYSVGLTYHANPAIALHAGVYFSKDQDTSANNSILLGLGGEYFLSKPTSLYVQLGMVHNKGVMGSGLSVQSTDSIAGFPAGTTISVNVGMRHFF